MRLAQPTALGTLALCGPRRATCCRGAAGRIPRIGILGIGSAPDPAPELFRQVLRELGYADGRNVVLEYWWRKGDSIAFPGLPPTSGRSRST